MGWLSRVSELNRAGLNWPRAVLLLDVVMLPWVAGALIGAAIAVLLLLIPASEHGLKLFSVNGALEVVAIILLMHGAAIRFVNYAIYCAAIAAGVLIFADLPQPSNYSAEGDRVLWSPAATGTVSPGDYRLGGLHRPEGLGGREAGGA